MCKALKAMIIAALLSALFMISAGAEEVTDINSLINETEAFNNQSVTVEGEAIGEVLERGEYAWVNISDGTNAIGVWMKAEDAESIGCFGDYKHIGDTIRITGVFSNNCTEHGGDVDIHCASMSIVKTGYSVKNTVSQTKTVYAAALLCLACAMALIYFRSVKKRKDSSNN